MRDLDLPCYKNFLQYSFYDVLIFMCRDSCMMALYPKKKLDDIRLGLERRAAEKEIEIPEEEMLTLVR